MKNHLKIVVLLLYSSFLSSCVPTLNYIGNHFDPTQKVEIFYDIKDVTQNYTVMGLLNFEYNFFTNSLNNEILSLMINKGKEVGADAVLVTKFKHYSKQIMEENINSKEKEIKNIEKMYIEAKFLKYKK